MDKKFRIYKSNIGQGTNGFMENKRVFFTILTFLILLAVSTPASAANPQIIVTTNRMVILDDPNDGYSGTNANSDTGFGVPGSWDRDFWKDESTTIRPVVLVLDENGNPASGITVTFNLKDWDDGTPRSLKSDTNGKTNSTNDNGLTTVKFNLNNEQQYGYWTVEVSATVNGNPVSSSTKFIYNWWGCQNCHGNPYSGSGDVKYSTTQPGSSDQYDPISPYITGRDFHNQMYKSDHVAGSDLDEGECWACHNSYDKDLHTGQAKRANGASYVGKGTPSTYGEHANLNCYECHRTLSSSTSGRLQYIDSCTESDCHLQVTGTKISNKNVTVQTVREASGSKTVKYSALDSTLGPRTLDGNDFHVTGIWEPDTLAGTLSHTSATTQFIPCTICHGPMHNVTKPNPDSTTNLYTEDSQCLTCHVDKKHSTDNPVTCTACHSQDAHKIRLLATDATTGNYPSNANDYGTDYVLRGSVNAINYTLDTCTACHNSSGTPKDIFNDLQNLGGNPPYSSNYFPETDWMGTNIAYHNASVGETTGVECTKCHQSANTTQYHAIPFLQTNTNGVFTTANETAVKCEDCHINGNPGNTYIEGQGESPPEVAQKHNGTLECTFCHNRSAHNKPYFISKNADLTDGIINQGDYTLIKADSIGANNCSACHVGISVTLKPYWDASSTSVPQKNYHNDSVTCDVCHNTMHDVKFLQSDGTYTSSQATAVECVDCHNGTNTVVRDLVNSSFGAYPPVINPYMNHSANASGQRWGNYWTTPNEACLYCHGNTEHNASALGIAGNALNTTDVVGGAIGTGTICSSCHNQGDSNYSVLNNSLDPKPPANEPGANYPISGASDHSGFGPTDAECEGCHGGLLSASTNMSEFVHNVNIGIGGGPNCIGCHNGTGSNNIDMPQFIQSPHFNINGGNTTNNLQCYMCHRDGTAPTQVQGEAEHDSATIRSNASSKNCIDSACHGNTTSTENRFNIESHSPNASSNYVQTTGGCDSCHSKLNVLIFNETNPGDTGNASMILGTGPVEHYIRDITDNATDNHYLIDSVGWGSSPSAGCIYCHKTDNGSVFNATRITHADDCYGCHIVGTTTLHERTVVSSGNGTADCLNCHGTDGLRPDVNTTAFIQSEHGNLNNAALNDTILNFTQSKACWACHSNGTEPDGHPTDPLGPDNPANVTNPLDCTDGDCHFNGTPAGSSFTDIIPGAYEHIKAFDVTKVSIVAGNCTDCHKNSLTPRIEPVFPGSANETDLSNVSHYANLTGPDMLKVKINTPNCVDCHKNTTNNLSWGGAPQIRHPVNKSVDFCLNCHDNGSSLHYENMSKAFDIHAYGFDWEGDGIDYDLLYNGNQSQDNEGCVACHDNNDEAAIMASISADGSNTVICEECHYNSGVGIYQGPFYGPGTLDSRDDIQNVIPRVFNHINDSNATIRIKKMNGTFNGTTSRLDSPSSCFSYNNGNGNGSCHGVSYNNRIDAEGYYAFNNFTDPADNMSAYEYTMTIDRMPNTSDCRLCHLGINLTVGKLVNSIYWGNPRNVSDTAPSAAEAHNDTLANASDCWSCHVAGQGQPVDFHAPNLTAGGGPNCISCHDVGSTSATKLVNVAAINGSLNSNASIHRAINNATEDGAGGSTGNPDNQICWACHQSDGKEPSGMGDKYKNPYKCYECHSSTPAYNNVSNAPKVFEHFLGGDNLTAANVSGVTTNSDSCLVCHNRSEMKVAYSEGIDNFTTNFSIPSHYGKNRSDLRTWTAGDGFTETVNCTYCHSNTTTDFKVAMNDPTGNSNILNHSRYDSTPNCTNSTCHFGGWMHNASLKMPALTTNDSGGAEDSDICLACHSTDNATGNVTTGGREKHNNSLNCTECHLLVKQDIHGVKYLLQNNTYGLSNSSSDVVNCTSCHNSAVVNSNLTLVPPRIPTDSYGIFNHSDNITAGQVWGNYWNNDTGACEYCHKDTKHSGGSALGRITNITGVARNSTDLANSTWCGSCHYKANTNYVNITGNFTDDVLEIPPEITNGTDWNGKTDYFNHTLLNYNDTDCAGCHGRFLDIPERTKEFLHNVNEAEIGPDCVSCHDIGGDVPKINVSAVNDTLSLHKNISTFDNISNPFNLNETNKICWACHMTNGQSPATNTSHADRLGDYNGVPVWTCIDCHVNTTAPYVNLTGLAPKVVEHFYGGQELKAGNSTSNISSCIICHNLSEMRLLDSGPSDADEPTEANYLIAHYGKKRSAGADNIRTVNGGVNCSYCHQGDSEFNTSLIMVNQSFNSSILNHSLGYNSTNPYCTKCHNGGWMHNASLTKPTNLTIESSVLCLSCHGDNSSGGTNYTGTMVTSIKSKHNNSLDCTECHIDNDNLSIHGIKYLQQDGSNYSIVNTTAVNCTGCHQNGASAITVSIPTINDPMYHSNNSWAGRKWNVTGSGPYWTTDLDACQYCHNDTKHEPDALGNLQSLRGETTDFDLGGRICVACHLDNVSESSYYSNVTANLTQLPPEITNDSKPTANDGSTQFYNHSTLSSFNDSTCKGCHQNSTALPGSAPANTTELAHDAYPANVSNCVGCHDAALDVVPANRMVNISATRNASDSLHFDLNNANSSDNLRCYACHNTTGTTHPLLSDVKYCADCHVGVSDFNAELVSRHIPDAGTQAPRSRSRLNTSLAQCWDCHINSINGTVGLLAENNISRVAHYGTNSSLLNTSSVSDLSIDNKCTDCHAETFNASDYRVPSDKRISMAQQIGCYQCHNGTWTQEPNSRGIYVWVFYPTPVSQFHVDTMGSYWACSSCHG